MASTYSIGDTITLTDTFDLRELEGIVTAIDTENDIYYVSVQPIGRTLRVDSSGNLID